MSTNDQATSPAKKKATVVAMAEARMNMASTVLIITTSSADTIQDPMKNRRNFQSVHV